MKDAKNYRVNKMIKKIYFFGIIILIFLWSVNISPLRAHAEPQDEVDFRETFIRSKVLSVLSSGIQSTGGITSFTEKMQVQLLEGKQKNKVIPITFSGDVLFGTKQRLAIGDAVVIDSRPDPSGKYYYSFYEPYRLNNLWYILTGFILLVVLVTGRKGIGSLIGLSISIGAIALYIIPQILNGKDPLTTCLTGIAIILFSTTYIAHGISVKTTVAIAGTAISLSLAIVLATFFVSVMHLLGLGSEDVYNLQLGTMHRINPQGLLLGSVLLGTLGALNDITTTQAITIFTLARENPKQRLSHLFYKSMTIGREHIASLVNTLVLAYAGSSLAIFIFFALNPAQLPWWLILNNETTMEEIIRTIVGSSALILAVPITTFISAYVALNGKNIIKKTKRTLEIKS